MDLTRCPRCNKQMKVVIAESGRTDFRCPKCYEVDPLKTDAVKWAKSSLTTEAA